VRVNGQLVAKDKDVEMHGGDKYRVNMDLYHSVHDDFAENNGSFAKLMWSSDHSYQMPIDPSYYYLTYKQPPLKISYFKSEKMTLGSMREKDDAFKDSDVFKLADIPLEYQGLSRLKQLTLVADKEIEFRITAPATIYVAFNAIKGNPLGMDWEDT
jgi:hypothetical protein